MGKRRPHRPRFQPVPLRERVGRSYDELLVAGLTSVTHLPWDMLERPHGPDTWVLCALGCERAYQLREAQWVLDVPGEYPRVMSRGDDGMWYCAYFPECDQDAVLHAWPWDELLAQGWNGPRVPVRGVRYPLYPDNG